MPHKIETLWAWVALDPIDGDESIPAMQLPDHVLMPLIGSDRVRVDVIHTMAEIVQAQGPIRMELRRFEYVATEEVMGENH